MNRGKLKVFLGAAPGVGKTYAMLEEGHRLRDEGRDVAIGYFEPHGRVETTDIAGDLEVIPGFAVFNSDFPATEMNVDAVLARHPDVALVDELAHANAPGLRHANRWQDVEQLLDDGIDVLTTINIQHLESLNDVVFEITKVMQWETIPDEVVRRADEIELVDLTQEGVRERLAAGKIYPAEEIDAAMTNYFRAGNLGALRELALSWTADRVDESVSLYRDLHGIDEPWETKERVVVGLAGAAGAESVVRRAARLAMRSGADLVGVHVRPIQGLLEESNQFITKERVLLEHLGGRYHEVVGRDVGTTLLAFAREKNATQIVLGSPKQTSVGRRSRGSPISKVIRDAGDVDVHVISYESGPVSPHPRRTPTATPVSRVRRGISWGIPLVGLPLLTWVLLLPSSSLELHNILLLYLLVAVTAGAVGGTAPAIVTAISGFLLANWFFTAPLQTWAISSPDDLFSLFAFLIVSVMVGFLVGYSSRRSAEAQTARVHAEALAATTLPRTASLTDQRALLNNVRDVLGIDAVTLIQRVDDKWVTLAWEGSDLLDQPNAGTESIELTGDVALMVGSGRLTGDDRIVLRAFGVQLVQAIERAELVRQAATAESMAETDRLRTALLRAVSHDLRTPLATIKASLTSLIETGVEWTAEETLAFLETALEETERLNMLVGHLLDASRVQVGAVHVFFRPVGVDEFIGSALTGLRSRADRVKVDISESLPQVQTDPDLMERVVANLVDNALTWSPVDQMVRISAGEVAGRVDIMIVDRGPGIPPADREIVFQPFQRMGDSPNNVGLGLAVARGLLEAMGSELLIEDTPGGGTTMVISLKVAEIAHTPSKQEMWSVRG